MCQYSICCRLLHEDAETLTCSGIECRRQHRRKGGSAGGVTHLRTSICCSAFKNANAWWRIPQADALCAYHVPAPGCTPQQLLGTLAVVRGTTQQRSWSVEQGRQPCKVPHCDVNSEQTMASPSASRLMTPRTCVPTCAGGICAVMDATPATAISLKAASSPDARASYTI